MAYYGVYTCYTSAQAVFNDPFRLEAVLGGQLLVLGVEGVDPVNHLLDQLHLGVAQAVLVRDVVGYS